MKLNTLILIATISFVLLLSPAVSLAAAGDHPGGGQGAVDMSGHNMDMPGHNMDMPGNGSMAGGGHDSGMEHDGSTPDAPGGAASHGDSSHGGQNSRQGQGGSNVDGRVVLGGFGLVNGLIVLSAAMLKRKSALAGGN